MTGIWRRFSHGPACETVARVLHGLLRSRAAGVVGLPGGMFIDV